MKIVHLKGEWFLIGDQVQEKFGEQWFNLKTQKGNFEIEPELLEQANKVYNCRRNK